MWILLVAFKLSKLGEKGGRWERRPWLTDFVKPFCRWVPKKAGRKGSSGKPAFQGKEYLHSADSRPERPTGRRNQSNASIISHQAFHCMLKKKNSAC